MNTTADHLLTPGQQATQALAEWGITAHPNDDAGNTWLVIGRDQTRPGFPHMLAEPYVVLYLHNNADDEITVTRLPIDGDHWHVIAGDNISAERTLMTRPADQLAECVEAIAEWVTNPLPTAGSVLLAALAEYGVTAYPDGLGMSYTIPLDPNTPELEICNRPHLTVADRSPLTDHDPADHTGWMVWLHDENGEPVGDALYAAGDGDRVDCTAESAEAAGFIADWLISHQH
ncbi:hypothetical protein [Streptomyces prasinus]|uniref:hypothetical protein n=1 Tax=Streptomyces prasinus TaxID=67345 RepID=UPI0036A7D91D